MSPQRGGEPEDEVARAIDADLGGFSAFMDAFTRATLTRFGGGWAWLCVDKHERLDVENTGDQDSQSMAGLMSDSHPILGRSGWEHAYYVQYQNRRVDYIAAFYSVINWSELSRR